MASVHARIEPTEADMRSAWARIRRNNWPATYEEAMADAVLSRLVTMNALHPGVPSQATTPARVPRETQPEPHHWTPPRGYTAPLPGFIDNKRRAAGERDDD